MFFLRAACVSNKGLIRARNEDYFLFNAQYLMPENDGLIKPAAMCSNTAETPIFAVFDGIGGEFDGEIAAYAAACCLQKSAFKRSFEGEEAYLRAICRSMNEAVLAKQRESCSYRMGTTAVVLLFSGDRVFSCNLGDSRAYRLRGKEITQLSQDHLMAYEGSTHHKAPLSQYLGVDPDEMRLEPHLSSNTLMHGDQYLLCSDGLTDMMSNPEIAEIMGKSQSPEDCAVRLIEAALMKGGRDNATVIVCEVTENTTRI